MNWMKISIESEGTFEKEHINILSGKAHQCAGFISSFADS